MPVVPPTSGVYRQFVSDALAWEARYKGHQLESNVAEGASREKTLREALADSERGFTELASKYQELAAGAGALKEERRHFETAMEAMRVEIDARQLKMAEMVDRIAALERDNEYKRSLLSEREQWYRAEYVRKLDGARIEEERSLQEMRELEMQGLRQEIERLGGELALERAAKEEMKQGKHANGNEELMKELEELRKKLAEKVKYGKNENRLLEGEKESVLSELMVKGYSKENRRLMQSTNQLTDELKHTKEEGLRRPPMVGEYELQQLRDSVKQLKEALEAKEDFYRQREEKTKNRLATVEALEDEIKSLRARSLAFDKQLEEKNREITSMTNSFKEKEKAYKEKLEIVSEEKERIKKDNQKKGDEGNRVRTENQSLKKEIKALREKVTELEASDTKIKDKKEINDLNLKIKSLTSTLKGLQKHQKQSLQTYNSNQPSINIDQHIDRSVDSYRDVLTRLSKEQNISKECKDLIAGIAAKINDGSDGKMKIAKIPIAHDIDLLDSQAIDEVEERFNGKNFDVDDYLEMEKSASRSAKDAPVKRVEVPELEQKKKLLRAVLSCLSKENPVYKLEHEWDRIFNFVAQQGFMTVKPALLEWRARLEGLDMNISQQDLVSLVNRSITYFNRGDLDTSKAAFDTLDINFYSALLSNLPRLLHGVRLSTAEDNRDMIIDSLQREKAVLEDTLRQMPADPRSVDFSVLERKIDMLEKRDKLRSLELLESMKQMTTRHEDHAECHKERERLVHIVKIKNREITKFRHEIDDLVLKLRELKVTN